MIEYKLGQTILVKVTGIQKYGIFISADNNYSGLIHISEISSSFVRNVNDYAKVGELIYAKIIDIDKKRKQLKLSIKELDYNLMRKNNPKIVETEKGFSTLEMKLDDWIKEKEAEINSEKLKK